MRLGDKPGTNQGLKFTVGKVVEDKGMPTVVDPVTGESFKPNLLVSTKNINRDIGGQLAEFMHVTRMCGSIANFRVRRESRRPQQGGDSLSSLDLDSSLPVAVLFHDSLLGEHMAVSSDERPPSSTSVMATYCILSIVQYRHV